MYNDVLKKWRDKAGMTQWEFANKLSLSVSTYASYETGKVSPGYKAVVNIIASGYDVSELFAEEIAAAKKRKEELDKRKKDLRKMWAIA